MTSSATLPVVAGTPLLDEGIRAVHFFNGRLLTGQDLAREQTARRDADARLGRGVGHGVVNGLEVTRHGAPSQRQLLVHKGLAVSRAGPTLRLGADQVLALVPQGSAPPPAGHGFGPCGVLSGGTHVAGAGVYLVTLAPLAHPEGKAPVLALEPGSVRCNTDAIVEAVQFRLLRIEPEVLATYGVPLSAAASAAPAVSRLRSALAHACFGQPALAQAHAHAGLAPGPGLLDAMRPRGLDDCEVPLAVVYLTATGGLVFVDRWAVRRRVAGVAAAADWQAWTAPALDALAEAQLAQFQEQLADIPTASLAGLAASDWFTWLPPAGFLPATGARALAWQGFLGARQPARFVSLAPGDARAVLAQALQRDPVPLNATTPAWRVYRIEGGPWLFVRDAPNARHAEEVWLDGERARLPGVHDVQSAIDALRARTCGQVSIWPGADLHGRLAKVPTGSDLSLCIEAGTYTLTQPLHLRGLRHVVIHGAGAASVLRRTNGEAALLVEDCDSLTISDLAVRADASGAGKGGLGIGLMGALTVMDTPVVHLQRLQARCAHGNELGAAGIVVSHAGPQSDAKQAVARQVDIETCEAVAGAHQVGILCVHGESVTIRHNSVRALDPGRPLERGIVVAGEVAREVRIEDNLLADVAQGIAVGLSRKESAPGAGLMAERVLVTRNSVHVALSDADLRQNRYGLFVGNAVSLSVQGNRVFVADTRVFDAGMEGLRLSGHYGRHLVVRDNHATGTPVGIDFAPQGSLPASGMHCLWFFEGNLAEQAHIIIRCSKEVQPLLREMNNLAI